MNTLSERLIFLLCDTQKVECSKYLHKENDVFVKRKATMLQSFPEALHQNNKGRGL